MYDCGAGRPVTFSGFIYLHWLEYEILPVSRGPRLRYAAGWMAGFGIRFSSVGRRREPAVVLLRVPDERDGGSRLELFGYTDESFLVEE